MKIIGAFLLLILSVSSLHVVAADWTHGAVEVNNIIWRPGYHGFYALRSTFDDPQNCADAGSNNLYVFHEDIETDEITMNRLFTILTTAMVAGKKVNVWVDGCRDAYPKIKGLQLNH